MTKCSLRSSNSTDEAILGQTGRVARLPRPWWHVSINEAQFLGGRPSLTRLTVGPLPALWWPVIFVLSTTVTCSSDDGAV